MITLVYSNNEFLKSKKYPCGWRHTGQAFGASLPICIWPQCVHIHCISSFLLNKVPSSKSVAYLPNLSPWTFSISAIFSNNLAIDSNPSSRAVFPKFLYTSSHSWSSLCCAALRCCAVLSYKSTGYAPDILIFSPANSFNLEKNCFACDFSWSAV